MGISPTLRFQVLSKWAFRCAYCGRCGKPDAPLEIDHVRPRAKGGRDEFENLLPACRECNIGKRDKIIDAAAFDDIELRTVDAAAAWILCYGTGTEFNRDDVFNFIAALGIERVKYHIFESFAVLNGRGKQDWLSLMVPPEMHAIAEVPPWPLFSFMCNAEIHPDRKLVLRDV